MKVKIPKAQVRRIEKRIASTKEKRVEAFVQAAVAVALKQPAKKQGRAKAKRVKPRHAAKRGLSQPRRATTLKPAAPSPPYKPPSAPAS